MERKTQGKGRGGEREKTGRALFQVGGPFSCKFFVSVCSATYNHGKRKEKGGKSSRGRNRKAREQTASGIFPVSVCLYLVS